MSRSADGVERFVVRGLSVEVRNTRPDIPTPAVVDRLDQALALVERYAPHAFRRLPRDFAVIWVERYACRAAFAPDARACLVELTFLHHPDITPAQVAASIVHEAVHARIHRMGVRVSEADHPREERLCREAELSFGRAVPGGEAVVERALAALGLADQDVAPVVDWRLAQARVAAADRRAGAG